MLVDLTQPYRDGMFSQHLFPPVSVTRCLSIEDRGVNVTRLSVVVHHGTHVDAPNHFIRGGRSIADIRLDEVSGDAVALSVNRGPGEAITAADLEARGAAVRTGDIVLIHTGWGPYFHTEPTRYALHPYLGSDAAAWLRDRQVKLVGVDTPTPDMPESVRPPGFDWPVHHLLLGSGVLVAEHLANLDLVAGRRFRAYLFPIPIVGSDGSPVRVVADMTNQGS